MPTESPKIEIGKLYKASLRARTEYAFARHINWEAFGSDDNICLSEDAILICVDTTYDNIILFSNNKLFQVKKDTYTDGGCVWLEEVIS